MLRRAVLLAEEEIIKPEHIDFLIKGRETPVENEKTSAINEFPCLSLEETEEMAIRKALDITNGNKSKAAKILKISYMTLFRKIKTYNI